ncbi:MAG: DUF3141 domain-containing protein, partial [Phycisphaerae bacterium]|nr:DUF3141 domain-containing protein [Phycisphaerae bacterium]MDW8261965.1 hypothetical protein [Phycisphaerales bacterium]
MRGCLRTFLAAFATAVGLVAPILRAQAPVTPIARTGDNALDYSGGLLGFTYHSVQVPFTATAGNAGSVSAIAFQGVLAGAGSSVNEGIWAGTPGDLRLAAREGDATPGIAGGTFDILSRPQVDASGRVAFWASYNGSPVNHGIWAGLPGSVSLVAHTSMT